MAQNVGQFEALFSAPAVSSSDQPPRDIKERPGPGMGPMPEKPSYQELERRYRHRTYQAQELMVEKLLRGFFADERGMGHKLRMFDLDFDQPSFLVVLVIPVGDITMFSSYDSDLRDGGQVGTIVSSIFSELLGEISACYPANLDDRYAFLLNFSRTDNAEASHKAVELCKYGVKFIRENFDLELRACVSVVSDSLRTLHEAFREAEMATVDPRTVYTDGVCARTDIGTSVGQMEPAVEKQYLNALVTQDFVMAQELTIERLREMCSVQGRGSLDRAKRFLNMRLQTTGSVLAMPMDQLLGEEGAPSVGSMRVEACETLEELEKVTGEIFAGLNTHFSANLSDYSGTTGKVVYLISKRYMEPDLSVERICDCLGKSRSYLSRMFKENTGMNLLDYLHTTRLTEAKKLLNDTDLGISEIASRVGYYSGWTLARVFKRYEGITPTAYRKAFCGMQEP